jgi:hypothetical protein
VTPETKELIRQKAITRWADPAFKAHVSTLMRGRTASVETRARMSAAKRGRTGRVHTDATKEKLRAKHLGKVLSNEHREKLRAVKVARPVNYWLGKKRGPMPLGWRDAIGKGNTGKRRSAEAIEKTASALRGRIRPPEVIAKMRAAVTPEVRARLSAMNRGRIRPPRQWHPYKGLQFRSGFEVRCAQSLDALGVLWEYEQYRFDLKRGTYTPDFYLPDDGAFWEVKGWFGPDSQRKTAEFRELYPHIPLVIVGKSTLKTLERSARSASLKIAS